MPILSARTMVQDDDSDVSGTASDASSDRNLRRSWPLMVSILVSAGGVLLAVGLVGWLLNLRGPSSSMLQDHKSRSKKENLVEVNIDCTFHAPDSDQARAVTQLETQQLAYALCITDNSEKYYLARDRVTDTIGGGDKVSLTIVAIPRAPDLNSSSTPWGQNNVPLNRVIAMHLLESEAQIRAAKRKQYAEKMAPRESNTGVKRAQTSRFRATSLLNAKEVSVLAMILKYTDKDMPTTKAEVRSKLVGNPVDAAGKPIGSVADMWANASYGKFSLPRSNVRILTLDMGASFAALHGSGQCPILQSGGVDELALQKVRQRGIDPDDYTFRELYMPDIGCQFIAMVEDNGLAHPSMLPNPGCCITFYQGNDISTIAHELGHQLGLGHSGGETGKGEWDGYGDPESVMGNSGAMTGYTIGAREHLGWLSVKPGEIIAWSPQSGNSIFKLGPMSMPLNQPGAQAVGIKIACVACTSKVTSYIQWYGTGGSLIVSFRGDEGFAKGVGTDYQNMVFVHYFRQVSKYRSTSSGGSELWWYGKSGNSFQLPESADKVYVCGISGGLATIAIGSSAVSEECGFSPAPPPPPPCEDKPMYGCDREGYLNDWNCNTGGVANGVPWKLLDVCCRTCSADFPPDSDCHDDPAYATACPAYKAHNMCDEYKDKCCATCGDASGALPGPSPTPTPQPTPESFPGCSDKAPNCDAVVQYDMCDEYQEWCCASCRTTTTAPPPITSPGPSPPASNGCHDDPQYECASVKDHNFCKRRVQWSSKLYGEYCCATCAATHDPNCVDKDNYNCPLIVEYDLCSEYGDGCCASCAAEAAAEVQCDPNGPFKSCPAGYHFDSTVTCTGNSINYNGAQWCGQDRCCKAV